MKMHIRLLKDKKKGTDYYDSLINSINDDIEI